MIFFLLQTLALSIWLTVVEYVTEDGFVHGWAVPPPVGELGLALEDGEVRAAAYAVHHLEIPLADLDLFIDQPRELLARRRRLDGADPQCMHVEDGPGREGQGGEESKGGGGVGRGRRVGKVDGEKRDGRQGGKMVGRQG